MSVRGGKNNLKGQRWVNATFFRSHPRRGNPSRDARRRTSQHSLLLYVEPAGGAAGRSFPENNKKALNAGELVRVSDISHFLALDQVA
jgi:hypothetical protein